MKIALTGATGFIGSYMLRRLLAEGHSVRCFVRPQSRGRLEVPSGAEDRVEVHEGDLVRFETIPGFTEGCDKLIHLAGHNDVGLTLEEMRPLHIEATEALHDDCVKHRKDGFEFLIFSSALLGLTVYSEWRDSKRVQEKIPRGGSVDSCAFRPGMVYGVGDRHFTAPLLRRCARKDGTIVVQHDGTALVNPVHVEDVVDAVIRYFDFERGIDCVYEIAGPKGIPYNEFLDLTIQAAGGGVKRKNVPNKTVERRMFWRGLLGRDVTQDRRTFVNATISHEYDISNAVHELGWRPRTYQEGIEQVAEGDWWRS